MQELSQVIPQGSIEQHHEQAARHPPQHQVVYLFAVNIPFNMRHLILAMSAAMLLPAVMKSQLRCISQEVTQHMLQGQGIQAPVHEQRPVPMLRAGGSYTVPVVVHVVWNTSAENVPDAYIMEMIDQMNEDYTATNSDLVNLRPVFAPFIGTAEIQFCLAGTDPDGAPTTGIVRTFTSTTWFDPLSDPDGMKQSPAGSDAWDPLHYLNVWVCDINSGLPPFFTIGGYANLPLPGLVGDWNDGLVLDHVYGIGPGTRTATHEAGHYLGLLHPWGQNGGCTDDDGFADTPMTEGPTYLCSNPAAQSCAVLTQYENFMDYSSCRVMFSLEQVAYMNGTLGGIRESLPSDDLCVVTTVENPRTDPRLSILSLGDRIIVSWPASFDATDVAMIDPVGRMVGQAMPVDGRHEFTGDDLAGGVYHVMVRSRTGWLSAKVPFGF